MPRQQRRDLAAPPTEWAGLRGRQAAVKENQGETERANGGLKETNRSCVELQSCLSPSYLLPFSSVG